MIAATTRAVTGQIHQHEEVRCQRCATTVDEWDTAPRLRRVKAGTHFQYLLAIRAPLLVRLCDYPTAIHGLSSTLEGKRRWFQDSHWRPASVEGRQIRSDNSLATAPIHRHSKHDHQIASRR